MGFNSILNQGYIEIISFDGVVKTWKKCAYALDKDLAGVFIWETWMDVPNFETDSSLMFHVNSVFPVHNLD